MLKALKGRFDTYTFQWMEVLPKLLRPSKLAWGYIVEACEDILKFELLTYEVNNLIFGLLTGCRIMAIRRDLEFRDGSSNLSALNCSLKN